MSSIVAKAYQRSHLILRSFSYRNPTFLVKLFTTYVRTLLEYASPVWNQLLIRDIDLIEGVQAFFTRRICYVEGSYMERLAALNLEPLELRRLQRDLCDVYKIVRCPDYSLAPDDFFDVLPVNSNRRSHNFMLKARLFLPLHRTLDVRKYSFACRTVEIWNSLPAAVAESSSLSKFRYSLLAIESTQFNKFLLGNRL